MNSLHRAVSRALVSLERIVLLPFSVMLVGGVLFAQPGDVTGIDIRLVEAAPDQLEIQLRPNAPWSFSDGVVNLTFAIRWQSASNATIDSDLIDQFFQGGPPFCMLVGVPLSGSTGIGIDNVDDGGFRYKGLNASGNQFPASCVFPANEWVPYARVPVAGISGCALFEIVVDDPFTNENNTSWFISLGGVEITANSQVVGPGVEIGACAVDCNGQLGGGALPGTSCDPGNACIINAVYNDDCECVGFPVEQVDIISFVTNSPICEGDALNLTVNATGAGSLEYSWSGAGGFQSNTATPSVSVMDPVQGQYTVVVSDGCSTAEQEVTVIVNATPTVDLGNYGPLCSGDEALELIGSPPGGVWSGTGVTGSTFDPSSGTQTVTYSLTQNGCTGSASTTITVNATPTVSVGNYGPLCSGDEALELIGSPPGGIWSGTGVTGSTFDPSSGTQTVTYSLTQNGCTGSASTTIVVTSSPTADFTLGNTELFVNEPIDFVNASSEGSYLWDFGDGGTSQEENPSHTYAALGSYTVTLTVEEGGCSSSFSLDIVVDMSTGIQRTANKDVRAWASYDHIVVEHSITQGTPLLIELMDAGGRVHMNLQVPGMPDRVLLPSSALSGGVWFVLVRSERSEDVFRVPVMR